MLQLTKKTESKLIALKKEAAAFINEAVSELRYTKSADHDLYVDLQAWLVNNKASDSSMLGLQRIKGAEGPKIHIDSHGNILTNPSAGGISARDSIGNFFSFDHTTQILSCNLEGSFQIQGSMFSIGVNANKMTFSLNKPLGMRQIGGGFLKFDATGCKIISIEGKCQVFLVGSDPHGRISTNASENVEIKLYTDPDAPLEVVSAADTPEIAEAESASSKVTSSAPPESAGASVTPAQLSSAEDGTIKESKVTFMSKISSYIEILKAATQPQVDSAAAGAPVYQAQDIEEAGSGLLAFATDNQYLSDTDYGDLIGQAKEVLNLE